MSHFFAQARRVRPGQILSMRVAPSFTARGGDNLIAAAVSTRADLFSIAVKGRRSLSGFDAGIRIRPLSYAIKSADQ